MLAAPSGGILDVTDRRLTLHQLARGWQRWMLSRNTPETTMSAYGDGLGKFLSFADRHGIQDPADVTVLLLEGFFLRLREQGASPGTVAHRRSVLTSFWRWLEHEGFADRNIPAKTYPIKTPKRVPVWLEPHQIRALLAKLAALPDLHGQRDHAIVSTFFYSGLRVSELVALTLGDVDTTAQRVRVQKGKGDKGRVVYMAPPLRDALQRYLVDVRPHLPGAEACSWLFLSVTRQGRRDRTTHPLLERSVFQLVRDRVRALLGLRLSPHKLRHTCASYLVYHGAQLETVQKLLGHSDVRTTMIYLHVPQKRQEDELARIFGRENLEGRE